MKKRFVLMCLAVVLIVGQVHAIDFSVGITTPGFGTGVLRGEAATNFIEGMDSSPGVKKNFGLSMFPVVQVDFMVEFLPFLALETGIGYGMSTVSWSAEFGGTEMTAGYIRDGIIIPLMARGQYDFGRVSVYGSIGPKFVIPISEYMYTEIDGEKQDQSPPDDYFNKFIVDLGFAIGAEYKLADVHHIGLRVGYDLNLVSPIKDDTERNDIKANDWYHDVFAVSLTYRYAF